LTYVMQFKEFWQNFVASTSVGLNDQDSFPLFGIAVSYIANTRQIVDKTIKDLQQNAFAAIAEQAHMESRPFTQNNDYLTNTSATLLKTMKNYRRSQTTGQQPVLDSAFLSVALDEYDVELDLIAHVLAYIKLAYRRFGDIIPMRVEAKFQEPLVGRIQKLLLEKLFTGDGVEERCRSLLEDSPELVAKRKELTGKLEVLRKADQEVRKFQAC